MPPRAAAEHGIVGKDRIALGYKAFQLHVDDGLAVVTLSRPQRGNSFDLTFCHEFGLLAVELSSRSDIRAVLLRATGSHFSVGGDLEQFTTDIDSAPATVLKSTIGLHTAMARLMRMDAPLIACVHATAAGGAVSIIANCDLVFSAESASFAAAYSHIGFTCDLGASFGLASRMGIARARRYLLLGEVLDAATAHEVGLVDYVLSDDAADEAARKAAERLSAGPTRAYGEVRRLLARSLGTPFEAQLEDEAQALARVAASRDARDGLSAFTEKRKPVFRGE